MNKIFIKLSVLVVTLTLGISSQLFISRLSTEFESFVLTPISPPEILQTENAVIPLDVDVEFDGTTNYGESLKVKLIQTGSFHSDEVPYRSGEKWLGLFRNGGTYYLGETAILVKRSIEEDLLDTEVSTKNPNNSVFLLRNSTGLSNGGVLTVFDRALGENGSFTNKNPKRFKLNWHFWTLRVENAGVHGYLQKGSALVLERDGIDRQVLRYLPDGCNDCSGSLLWAGDLDHDNNLDLLLDLSGHYNSYEPTLFLSSEAKPGSKLVEIVAGFTGVGC